MFATKLKEYIIIAFMATIMFVLEQILTFLPNIQLTFLLLIVYSKVFKFKNTMLIILIHVILDNLFMGSFNIIYLPFMFIGYSLVPITICSLKNINSSIHLALISIVLSIGYCLIFIIPNCFILNVEFMDYLILDIPFEVILATSSFISVLWLYEPLVKFLNDKLRQSV